MGCSACGHLLLLLLCRAAAAADVIGAPPTPPQQNPGTSAGAVKGDLYDEYELYAEGYDNTLFREDGSGRPNPYTLGYDESYEDEYELRPQPSEQLLSECADKPDGTQLKTTKACEVRITGADDVLPLLTGGVDGIYKPVACNDGRPMYVRQGSPEHEDRVIWWSNKFSDWDLGNGTKPAQNDDVIMYGGGLGDARPQHVLKWSLSTEFQLENTSTDDYTAADIAVECANPSDEDAAHKKTKGSAVTEDKKQKKENKKKEPARSKREESAGTLNGKEAAATSEEPATPPASKGKPAGAQDAGSSKAAGAAAAGAPGSNAAAPDGAAAAGSDYDPADGASAGSNAGGAAGKGTGGSGSGGNSVEAAGAAAAGQSEEAQGEQRVGLSGAGALESDSSGDSGGKGPDSSGGKGGVEGSGLKGGAAVNDGLPAGSDSSSGGGSLESPEVEEEEGEDDDDHEWRNENEWENENGDVEWPHDDDEDGTGAAGRLQRLESLSAAEAEAEKAKEFLAPILSDSEMDQQYSLVYQRAAALRKAAGANAVMGGTFVACAVGIAVGLPLLYVRQRRIKHSMARSGEPMYMAMSQAVRRARQRAQ